MDKQIAKLVAATAATETALALSVVPDAPSV